MKFIELTYAQTKIKTLIKASKIDEVIKRPDGMTEIYMDGMRNIVEEDFKTVKTLLEGATE